MSMEHTKNGKDVVVAGNWDGKTRPSNEKYRKNYEEIFGQKEQEELAESMKQSIRNKEERLKKEEKTNDKK